MGASEVMKIDGTRLDFQDGPWILIRLSGTEAKVRVYGEAREKVRAWKWSSDVNQFLKEELMTRP